MRKWACTHHFLPRVTDAHCFFLLSFLAGMEGGHPGRPGASAAQAVRLGLKSASDPVTILRPGMAAECVWGKAENRGKKRG